jgi:tetratricopeptide (TPR) repeat protein
MNFKQRQIHFFQHSAKYYLYYSIVFAMMVAVAVFTIVKPMVLNNLIWNYFSILYTCLVVVLYFFWASLFGVYFSWFRYLLYVWAILIKIVKRFTESMVFKSIIILTLTLLIQGRRFLLLNQWADKSTQEKIQEFLEFKSLTLTIAIALSIWFLYRIIISRKLLVISSFKNYTGIEEMSYSAQSVSIRLLIELKNLNELIIDLERIKQKKKDGILETTVSIHDIGKNLNEMIGPESRVEIGGFLKVHLDAVFAFFAIIMHGPILSGSLHKNGDKLIMTARLKGGGYNETWSINSEDLTPPISVIQSELVVQMTDQLVYQIFTLLAKGVSKRWKAVKYYTEGLRLYKEAVDTEIEKKINLLRAKQELTRSLREDESFSQCYYHLGIVYYELGNISAAQTSFREGLIKKANNFDCYFKLAFLQLNLNKNNHQDSRWLSSEACAISPTHPFPWNLLGVSFFKELNPILETNDKIHLDPKYKEMIVHFRVATTLSWKTLCETIKKGEDYEQLKNATAICLLNLAKMLGKKKRVYDVCNFKQALFLAPHDNEIYFDLGKYYFKRSQFKDAFNAFFRVFQDDKGVIRIKYWAYYSKSCAELYDRYKNKISGNLIKTQDYYKELIQSNYLHFLNAVADKIQNKDYKLSKKDIDEYIKEMKDALSRIGEIETKNNLDTLEILDQSVYYILNAEKIDSIFQDSVDSFLNELESAGNSYFFEWAEAQYKLAVGNRLIQRPDSVKNGRKDYLVPAYKFLYDKHFLQLKKQKVALAIARSYLMEKDYKTALFHGKIALNHNPYDAQEYHLLGEIYFNLHDVKEGFNMWKISFDLNPPRPIEIIQMGETILEVGEQLPNLNLRKELFNDAIDFLIRMKDFMDSYPTKESNRAKLIYSSQLEAINYFLGVFNSEFLNFEEAVYHFRVALRITKVVKTFRKLAWTYFDMNLPGKAEEVFQEGIKFIKSSEGKGGDEKENEIPNTIEFTLGIVMCKLQKVPFTVVDKEITSDLKEMQKKIDCLENQSKRDQLTALLLECKGLFAQKRMHNKLQLKGILSNKYKKSIKIFEESIRYNRSPRVYCQIVLTYSEWSIKSKFRNKKWMSKQMQSAAKLCQVHDLRGHYHEEINDCINIKPQE